jgi:hypothetical protein
MLWRAGAVTEAEHKSHCFYIIKNWIEAIPAKHKVVILSNQDRDVNYRYELATIKPYKGNRKSTKPLHYEDSYEYLVKHHGAITTTQGEADDFVSACSYERRWEIGETCLIASIDKDLLNTPGTHFNWVTGEIKEVTYAMANKNFYTQCLSGHSTDNIMGLPEVTPQMKYYARDARGIRKKCGIKTAEKLMETCSSDERSLAIRVIACYLSHAKKEFQFDTSMTDEEIIQCGLLCFLENARLLWIERKYRERYKVPEGIAINPSGGRLIDTTTSLMDGPYVNLREYIEENNL